MDTRQIEREQMFDTITDHYLICALWSSNDEDGNPLDDGRSILINIDISAECRVASRNDVVSFVELLEREGIDWQSHMTYEQFGHDFWLTRNGHGAGFWDRGLGELGETLTKWANTYSSVDMYAGDDGLIYCQ